MQHEGSNNKELSNLVREAIYKTLDRPQEVEEALLENPIAADMVSKILEVMA